MLRDELLGRVKALQDKISASGLDSYVVSSEDSIWYLSAISYKPEERPFFIVVKPGEKPVMVVPKMEEAHLSKTLLECSIVSYWEYPSPTGTNWFETLADVTGTSSRVGVEVNIPADILDKIKAGEVVRIDLIGDLRKVKSLAEISAIRKTAAKCDSAMAMIFKNAYVGATAVEPFALSKSIQTDLIKSREFDPITTSLLTAVWPAPVSAMPHSIPDLADRMSKGPNVAMSYFRINGYAAECERTFFLGSSDEDDKIRFAHMMEARKLALSMVKAGMSCSDLDAEVKSFLIARGYKDNLLHRTGHGIGMGNHEMPWLAEGSDDTLMKNMVISVEPGLYFAGCGGYRHSDTVLVTESGYEMLTKFPADLDAVTITGSNTMAKLKGKIIQKTLNI
jgi:Xaa-Pro dipeptidase